MAEKIIGSDETGNEVEMYPDPTGTITTTQELINAANTAITEANAANAIAQQTAEETEWMILCMAGNALRYSIRLANSRAGTPFWFRIGQDAS